jgi:hypothetical protein
MNGFGGAVQRSCAALLRRPRSAEYGLLVPVARVRSAAGGRATRRLLELIGIRSTVAPCPQAGTDDGGGDGGWTGQVLVFAKDAAHARRLLSALPAAPSTPRDWPGPDRGPDNR